MVVPATAPERAAGPERAAAAAADAPVASTPLPLDEPWEAVVVEPAPPAPPAPWEAALLEPDGTPLPAGPAGEQVATPTTTTAPAAEETARALGAAGSSTAVPAVVVPTERAHLRRTLIRYAQENGLPADLVMAQAWVESSWRARVVSESGAVGVMQLMPATVEFVSRRLLGLAHHLDPRDPVANIRMGTRFLRHLVDRTGGDLRRGLLAYNQGLTSLRANGPYRQAERYADRVLALRPAFR
jgi:soluble lytic murein transglycosylase-like protein